MPVSSKKSVKNIQNNRRSTLNKWVILAGAALVVVVGVVIVRFSGASGKVWPANQFQGVKASDIKAKSNGTSYWQPPTVPVGTTLANAPQAQVELAIPASSPYPGGMFCAYYNVLSDKATVAFGSQAVSATSPGVYNFDLDHNQEVVYQNKGDQLSFCEHTDTIGRGSNLYGVKVASRFKILAGSVQVFSIKQLATSYTNWYPYNFISNKTHKLVPTSEIKKDASGKTYWDGKNGAAYISLVAFAGQPWPGTVYCAQVKGIAATSKISMGGDSGILDAQAGGDLPLQTVDVAQGKDAEVCTTASAQSQNNDYIISPEVIVWTGEVAVYQIYKKQ